MTTPSQPHTTFPRPDVFSAPCAQNAGMVLDEKHTHMHAHGGPDSTEHTCSTDRAPSVTGKVLFIPRASCRRQASKHTHQHHPPFQAMHTLFPWPQSVWTTWPWGAPSEILELRHVGICMCAYGCVCPCLVAFYMDIYMYIYIYTHTYIHTLCTLLRYLMPA